MFRPYQPPQQHRNRVPQRKTSFTHRFICLVGRRQEVIPSPAERYELEKVGLGEKRITFPGTEQSAVQGVHVESIIIIISITIIYY